MYKLFLCFIVLLLNFNPKITYAQSKASDFFRDLSNEKNILEALYANKQEAKNSEIDPFTMAGEAGLLNTTGNTSTSIIKLAIESSHELPEWSNRYETRFLHRVNKLRSETGDISIDDTRFEISAQFDYKLINPNERFFAYFEYDDNQFNRLRDQTTLVVGWSQVAWKKAGSEFRYSIGPGYSYFVQERNDLVIEETIIRGTLWYQYTLSDNARFRQTISAEVGEVITKARSQSSITANIFGNLAMKISLDFILNENVAIEDDNFSTETSISMVYQFF